MSVECDECGERFPSGQSLGGHIAQNHHRGEYECPSCDRKFDTKTGLGNHHYYSHGESLVEEKTGFDCPRENCNEEFGSKRAVKVHHKKIHGESISENKKICEYCDEEFIEQSGNIGRFCKDTCYGLWRRDRVTRACEYCGEEVTRKRSEMQWRYIFCSEKHKHQYQKENDDYYPLTGVGTSYRGPSWSQNRKKVLERDNYECQLCGTNENTDGREMCVHHIIPFREFGVENHEEANKLDNLISLCDSCHVKAEHGNQNV